MLQSVLDETRKNLNFTSMGIFLLLLLLFTNAKAQSPYQTDHFHAPAGSYLQAESGVMYLSDYTLYRLEAIGVLNDPNQPKVRIKSELNFPLHTWLAGGQLQYTFPISKGHAFSLSGDIYTNIGNNYGQMTDQDWINDIQIGYTEAPKSDLKALNTILTLKYHFLNTSYSDIYLLGRVLYQRFEFQNQGYWGWTVNYQTSVLYEIQGDAPTVNYTVQYLHPQLGMGFRLPLLQSLYLEFESSSGVSFARDEDDHILRKKLSKGEAVGFSTFSTIKFQIIPFSFGNHSLFIDLYGDLQYVHAKGNQTQRWYADRDQPAGTIIKDIPYRFESLQYAVGVRAGLNLNLSGHNQISPSPPAKNMIYSKANQQEEINYQITGEKLIIQWKSVEQALYDIYGKSANTDGWIKLNKAQLSNNHVSFTRTKLIGHFQFKVIINTKDGHNLETRILNIDLDK